MPYLAIDQENTGAHLALFAVDDDGYLYDPATVEVLIQDLSTGSAVQVYPASGYEDITSGGKVSKGHWYAYDTGTSLGWTPSGNEGKHRIKWRFTSADGTETRTWQQDFYVAASGLDAPYWTYISPNEVRAEGLTTAQCSDARLIDLILRAQDYIDASTRQMFRPVPQTLKMDGPESHTMHLNLPIVGLEFIKANSSTTALAQSSVAVYVTTALAAGRHPFQKDYRRNPKLSLKADLSLYSGAFVHDTGVFAVGRRNQTIKGVYGFLEADGTTPALIAHAMLRLVYGTATALTISASSSSGSTAGPIRRERVDRHEVEYVDKTTTSTTALSGSPEVEEIIQRYRAPIIIGAVPPRTASRVVVY